MKLLVFIKDSAFGLVVIVWGLILLFSTEIAKEMSLTLLFLTFTPASLGVLFVVVGLLHLLSKHSASLYFMAFANISIALVFLLAMLTHLFVSVYAIAWIAFAGICLNLMINAFLIVKSNENI